MNNRPNSFNILATAVLGIVLLLPSNAFAQQAADTEGAKAASKAFYTLLAVLIPITSLMSAHAAKRSSSAGMLRRNTGWTPKGSPIAAGNMAQ
jgi:hypothetical protein